MIPPVNPFDQKLYHFPRTTIGEDIIWRDGQPFYCDGRPVKSRELRAAAVEAGSQYFTTGKPCRRGHNSRRYVVSGACVACLSTFSAPAVGRSMTTFHYSLSLPTDLAEGDTLRNLITYWLYCYFAQRDKERNLMSNPFNRQKIDIMLATGIPYTQIDKKVIAAYLNANYVPKNTQAPT